MIEQIMNFQYSADHRYSEIRFTMHAKRIHNEAYATELTNQSASNSPTWHWKNGK